MPLFRGNARFCQMITLGDLTKRSLGCRSISAKAGALVCLEVCKNTSEALIDGSRLAPSGYRFFVWRRTVDGPFEELREATARNLGWGGAPEIWASRAATAERKLSGITFA
jgi:hypothetical protein